jgi:Rieske Fe-S protein
MRGMAPEHTVPEQMDLEQQRVAPKDPSASGRAHPAHLSAGRVALSRRTILVGGAGLVGAGVLVGCSSSSSEPAASRDAAGDGTLIDAADVPVGGGVIVGDVVVVQPTEGEFLAYSAICTHQGCKVNQVGDGAIRCPCHGSVFAVEDGSVRTGPAGAPLPAVSVSVEGGVVSRA